MQRREGISELVIHRLPRYYRFLGELIKAGSSRISSRELSEKMGLTASQIRQDLNCFGGFGQQGYGYNIADLHKEIGRILGLDTPKNAILIGAGNLGKAVASYMDFPQRGFHLVGIFDVSPEKVGHSIKGVKVLHISQLATLCEQYKPSAAILCIPKEAARMLAGDLVSYGITGFLNFSHYDLAMDYQDVNVENVHISDSLITLRYKIG